MTLRTGALEVYYPEELTNPARDPIAKIPELKVCAVRIEKIAR